MMSAMSFRRCLEQKKLIRSNEARYLIEKEESLAKDDFDNARFGLKNKRYRWSVIQSYYSMFHSARALLYSKGYRERSHLCLYLAIKEMFVKNNKVSMKILDSFQKARFLREDADYKGEFTKTI